MDNASRNAVIILCIFLVLYLVRDLRNSEEVNRQMISLLAQSNDELLRCETRRETAQFELETCRQDAEAMEVSLNVASTDLRRCDEWYAVREYAADADY